MNQETAGPVRNVTWQRYHVMKSGMFDKALMTSMRARLATRMLGDGAQATETDQEATYRAVTKNRRRYDDHDKNDLNLAAFSSAGTK